VLLPPAAARAPILLAITLWGMSAWAFFPAQQTRLISMTGMNVAPVALSLNASFQFLGFSAGAALGSLTMVNASPLALGWVGASCEALVLEAFDTLFNRRDYTDRGQRVALDFISDHVPPVMPTPRAILVAG
jgi:predicted MFS family arabinose efflux permease